MVNTTTPTSSTSTSISSNNNNKMQELLSKIQKVSNDDFNSLYEQIFELLDESKHKTYEQRHLKENFIEKLVDLYLQTYSDRVFKILVGISSPLDECLFNILMKKINVKSNVEKRFAVFILISNVVHRSPSWLPNIINMPLLNCFFNILKNDQEIDILAIAALILVELIAALPCLMTQCLDDIFVCFSRLSTFLYKGMNEKLFTTTIGPIDKKNLSFLNLNSILYRVFIRLYAMYPCNFLDYLKQTYGGNGNNKENLAVFRTIIQPLLNKIRFHPFLITASKERECDKTRWFYKEPHDILVECGQYSIDPIESSNHHFIIEDVTQLYELFQKHNVVDNIDDVVNIDQIVNNNDEDGNIIDEQQPEQEIHSMNIKNSIFNELNKLINENEQNLSSLCSIKKQQQQGGSEFKNIDDLESAQEAINMSQKIATGSNIGSLFKPVAISAATNNTTIQKKNNLTTTTTTTITAKKQQSCFSPFKPIKEIGNVSKTATSPIVDCNLNNCNSVDHNVGINNNNNNNDNDDVDIEIMGYNFEKDDNDDDNKNRTITKSDNRNESIITEDNDDDDNDDSDNDDKTQINDEFVQNIKSSFKKLNTRIRYQSNCTQQQQDFDFNNSIELLEMKKFSKSCPMLQFDFVQNQKNKDVQQNKNIENNKKQRRKSSTEKSTQPNVVNLNIDNNSITESKQSTTTTMMMNKTCKSVDFTKEQIKSIFFQQYDPTTRNYYYYNRLLLNEQQQQQPGTTTNRHHLFQSSIDFHQTPQSSSLKFESPHVLLDRTLSTLSEFYLKDSATATNERNNFVENDLNDNQSSNQTSRRNSMIMNNTNTNSNTSSIEHIPSSLNYLNHCTNPNEEDMKKILAIMYAQLVFERHQRNLHVIRNRRLYKKSKECIQLEEQFRSMKQQYKMLIKELETMKTMIKENSKKYEKEKQQYREEIQQMQKNLNKYKNNYDELLNEKSTLELQYRQEIDCLNRNFRTKEVELNKFLCNFDRNVDIIKLEQENLDLKKRMFSFGEFCDKIKDVYCHRKSVTPEINDKFIYESLRFENEDLQKRNTDLETKLKFFIEKCQTLETECKRVEITKKQRLELEELDYIRECLKAKDKQIDVMKTMVVNYEAHIKKLNGEMIALKLTPGNNNNNNNGNVTKQK